MPLSGLNLRRDEIRDDFIEGAALFNGGTQNHRFVVPRGERWLIITGWANRDVSGNLSVYVKNFAAETVYFLSFEGAATGTTWFPEGFSGATMPMTHGVPYIMKQDDYLEISFGAIQTGGAKVFFRRLVLKGVSD